MIVMRLTEIAKTVGASTPNIPGNNPAPIVDNNPDTFQYAPRIKEIGNDVVANRHAVAANGLLARKHLHNLESIKVMKQIAGVEAQDV
jgi:hypothetical protein